MRLKIGNLSLVEAAHIIPFEETQNDRPSNGLALCPNHHRAMDRGLIAPCWHGDHKTGIWKVSRRIEARIAAHKDLASLAGQRVRVPENTSFKDFYPASDSLRWREQKLDAA
jgi:putative restriction endonuclease